MVKLTDIHPLTGFLRDHKEHMERLAATGRPEVLTVNGKARIVVQDAEAYQRMVEALDAVETERIVRDRLASVDRKEPGIPADQVLTDVRKRLGTKRK
ncbi:MAG: hypothetical protein KF912_13270 [Phycisphaeraceae bacterium]|nr:hypothetical protein [Phycisphaeraceae bacterium]MBX3368276.1 hypothetical protein [Phycisphaeraceae bacterium]